MRDQEESYFIKVESYFIKVKADSIQIRGLIQHVHCTAILIVLLKFSQIRVPFELQNILDHKM